MSLWHNVLQQLKEKDDRPTAPSSEIQSQADWLAQEAKVLAASEESRRVAFADSGAEASRERVEAIKRLVSTVSTAVNVVKQSKRIVFPGGRNDDGFETEQEPISSRFSIIDSSENDEKSAVLLLRATWAARSLRNVVAGVAEGQETCFDQAVSECVASLWVLTSYAFEGDKEATLLARTLVQLLCNLITDHDLLQDRFWKEHLGLQSSHGSKTRPGAELLARMLGSVDTGTSLAASVLLVNLTAASKERSAALTREGNGRSIITALLQLIASRLDEEEDEEEREEWGAAMLDSDSALDIPLHVDPEVSMRKQQRIEGLGIFYTLFTRLFDQGLLPDMIASLGQSSAADDGDRGAEANIITSSRISLLKLFDAYLHSQMPRQGGVGLECSPLPFLESCTCLVGLFTSVARWAQSTMQDSMTVTASQASPVDVRLVDQHIALILLLQCLSNIVMSSEALQGESTSSAPLEGTVAQLRGEACVSAIIPLLHTTNAFSPAISPFVPSNGATTTNGFPQEAPAGHTLSSTGRAAAQAANSTDTDAPRPRLDKLKRDLVALISVLAYEREGADRRETERQDVRRFQDAVRERGGLVDVLNMTQLDEHNPYIREHAIFALRNLLKGNQASQDFISQIRPIAPDAPQ